MNLHVDDGGRGISYLKINRIMQPSLHYEMKWMYYLKVSCHLILGLY